MQDVNIESASETNEQVVAATGGKKEVDKQSAAPVETEVEIQEDSETSQELEENSTDSEDEADGSEEPEAKEKQPKKNGFKKKIGKLITRISDRDRTIAELQSRLAGQAESPQKAETNESVAQVGRPDPDTFESHSDYLEALTDWKVDQRDELKERNARAAKAMESQQSKVSSHVERVNAAKESFDDFDDAIDAVDDIPMSQAVQDAILDSDNSADLMYQLAKNPEEYARICGLPKDQALRAIGRFEARIEKQDTETKETKTIKKSTAPPPLKTVGQKSSAIVGKSLDDMDEDEFIRTRNEQLRKRRY